MSNLWQAALVLGNAPIHPSELACDDAKVMVLLPNVTSLVQSIDQGFIVTLRHIATVKVLS